MQELSSYCKVVVCFLLAIRGCMGQYDFPIDSCSCHIHYEVWQQFQLKVSRIFTSDFPEELFDEGSYAYSIVQAESCPSPWKIKNVLEWTLQLANTDCAVGHVVTYIICAQQALLDADVERARSNFDFANFLFPFAMPCMDAAIWTVTAEAFYDRYRVMVGAVDLQLMDWQQLRLRKLQDRLSDEDMAVLKELAWRPVQKGDRPKRLSEL
mmetsp:Transcript_25452/g.59259  ORF Transcript_25452/g.59259 Transcript_25452/m.59259 type:complete len:210 (+) Transcript_25452:131-760(+)